MTEAIQAVAASLGTGSFADLKRAAGAVGRTVPNKKAGFSVKTEIVDPDADYEHILRAADEAFGVPLSLGGPDAWTTRRVGEAYVTTRRSVKSASLALDVEPAGTREYDDHLGFKYLEPGQMWHNWDAHVVRPEEQWTLGPFQDWASFATHLPVALGSLVEDFHALNRYLGDVSLLVGPVDFARSSAIQLTLGGIRTHLTFRDGDGVRTITMDHADHSDATGREIAGRLLAALESWDIDDPSDLRAGFTNEAHGPPADERWWLGELAWESVQFHGLRLESWR